MRRILTDFRAWMALFALTLIIGVARAGGPSDSGEVGYTVEQNGKRVEYLHTDQWRADFAQASMKLSNTKLGLEVHYYGAFCVSHRSHKR